MKASHYWHLISPTQWPLLPNTWTSPRKIHHAKSLACLSDVAPLTSFLEEKSLLLTFPRFCLIRNLPCFVCFAPHNSSRLDQYTYTQTMKLAIASLLVGSAAAFAPGATFNARNTALNMAAETADKVRVFVGFLRNMWSEHVNRRSKQFDEQSTTARRQSLVNRDGCDSVITQKSLY